jgi:hypothetical protein
MKQVTVLTPEFDVGDEVAFIKERAITKGTVRNITQAFGKHPKIFYQISVGDDTLVLDESQLLFAEVGFAKPMFAIGMKVKDDNGTEGTIIGITIDLDVHVFSVMYTLDTADLISEEDITELL